MAGAAGNRKRSDPPTPDNRPAKKQFLGGSSNTPSSPEEGELEDGEEEQREQSQALQQVPARKFQTKVPFPFKTASTSAAVADDYGNDARSTVSRSPTSPPPSQAMKHRLPPKPPVSSASPRRGVDRYVPPYRDEKEWEREHHHHHQHPRHDYFPRREYDSWRPEYEDVPARPNYTYRPMSRSRSRSRSRERLRSDSLSRPRSPRPHAHSPWPSRPPPLPELPPPPIPSSTSQLPSKRDSVQFSIPKTHGQSPSTPVPPPPPSILKPLEYPSQERQAAPTPTHVSLSRKPRRPPIQRTNSADLKTYGRLFTGCGRIDDYDIATKVGEGTFGEVHKAVHRPTSAQVALKRILMHNEKEGMPITAIREIKILKKLDHPNVVQLKEVIVQRSNTGPTSFHMVFPYMDHDLAGLLENERVQLTPSQIKLYLKQLLEGTAYMHANNIIHRDMKAANLLISNTGLLQIADFGLARPFDPQAALTAPRNGDSSTSTAPRYTNCVVTRWYRPPELFLGARRYGGEIDMWGIGCVLGEIFIRRPILMGSSDANQLDLIWQLCGSPSGETWPDYDSLPGLDGVKRWNRYDRQVKTKFHAIGPETVDLLDKLLTLDPSRRIGAVQALDHDWFWSDPMPADPKTLPKYESSHEIDKRSKRQIPVLLPGGPGPNAPPPPHNLPPPMYNPHAQNHNSNASFPLPPPPSHGQAGHNLPPPLASFGGPGNPPVVGPGSSVPPYPGPGQMIYPPPPHYPHHPPHGYPPPPNWRPPPNWFATSLHPNQPYIMGMPPTSGPGGLPVHGGMGMAYHPPYGQQQQHGQRRHHNHHNYNHNRNNNNHNSGNFKPSIWPPPGTHGLPPKPKVDLPPLPDSGKGNYGVAGRGDGGRDRKDQTYDRDSKRSNDFAEHDVGQGPGCRNSDNPSGDALKSDPALMSSLPYD